MFDDESEFNFAAEVAKSGRASCKHCKTNCEKDQVRLAKLLPNPFGWVEIQPGFSPAYFEFSAYHVNDELLQIAPNCSSGKMKQWYHIDCLFEAFTKQRATTRKIESASDIFGWETLNAEFQDRLLEKIKQSGGSSARPDAKKQVTIHLKTNSFNSIRILMWLGQPEIRFSDSSSNWNCARERWFIGGISQHLQ